MQVDRNMRPEGSAERCLWCAQVLPRIEVHGHAQCAACGINVDPCCGGAQAACPPPRD